MQDKAVPWAWGLGVFGLFMLVLAGSSRAFQGNRQLEGAKYPVLFLQVGVIPNAWEYMITWGAHSAPLLGPVEIAVSERDRARAEEIVKAIGPEVALRVPP
ncbi:MAG: hypothetical protein NZ930_01610 [Candidatus Bipolaricaulota bacterium]|nr:hypothetical protein [Candidatus Bipolaricaulota bacterium]MDW8030230.1 hypothetical protein [Candidatus Bipolaricaulota bacterium]